jgi:ubiquinone/menaquinone biosynthesis C-methylase UbiE
MDAGCGDGHNAIKVVEEYLPNGTVYAVDIYDASIEDMETYKKENKVVNLINIEADITEGIPGVEDESIDVVLMVNVFHGFKASRKIDEAISEFARIIQEEYGVQASRSTIYNFLRKGRIRSPQRKAKKRKVISYDDQGNKIIQIVRVYDRKTTNNPSGKKVIASTTIKPARKPSTAAKTTKKTTTKKTTKK